MLLIPLGHLWEINEGPARTPPSLGPIWSSAKHCLSEGGRAPSQRPPSSGSSQGRAEGELNPGETWGEEEAGEGAEAASHDSPTSTQSAQWHLRSPAPNSNLVRLPKAESAPARHESSIPRGSLPETLASNQGQGRAPRLQQPWLSRAAQQDHVRECASWAVKSSLWPRPWTTV